jgi:hypothetical protein
VPFLVHQVALAQHLGAAVVDGVVRAVTLLEHVQEVSECIHILDSFNKFGKTLRRLAVKGQN